MQKTVFWLLTAVLVVVMGASSVLWFRSFHHSEQAVLRLGTPGVTVMTTDRGRLALLFLGAQPTGPRWVARWRVNPELKHVMPKLETFCEDSALGFGLDSKVVIEGIEKPAVASIRPEGDISWAVRRVVIPFWAIFFGALGGALVWFAVIGKRIYRIDHGLCVKCSYDVSQCSHFCPRCGKAIPNRTWSGEARPMRRGAGRPAVPLPGLADGV